MDGKPSYVARFVAAVRRRKPKDGEDDVKSVSEEHLDLERINAAFTRKDDVIDLFPECRGAEAQSPSCSSITSGSTLESLNGSDSSESSSVQDTTAQVLSLVDELAKAALEKSLPRDGLCEFLATYLEDKLAQRSRADRRKHSARHSALEFKQKERHLASHSPDFAHVRQGTLVGSQEFASLRDDVQVSAYDVFSDARRGIQLKPSFKLPQGDPCQGTLMGHRGGITDIHIIAGHVITSSMDSTIRFWEMHSGEEVKQAKCHRPINTFALLRVENRKYIMLAGCNMGEVELFKVKFGNSVHVKQLTKYAFHVPNAVTSIRVSPDRLHLASACCYSMFTIDQRVLVPSARGNFKMWRVQDITAVLLPETPEEVNPPYRIMSTARQLIANATGIKRISGTLYCGTGGRVHDFGVTGIEYTPDSSLLIVGFGFPVDCSEQFPKLVVVCCVDTLAPVYLHQNSCCPITNLVSFGLSPLRSLYYDGEDVSCGVVIQTSRTLYRMRLSKKQRGDLQAKLDEEWHTTPECLQYAAAVSPDNLLIAAVHSKQSEMTGRTTYKLSFYDAMTGEVVASHDTRHTRPVTKVMYSPFGNVLCTAAADGTVQMWRCPLEQLASDPFSKTSPGKSKTQVPQFGNFLHVFNEPPPQPNGIASVPEMNEIRNSCPDVNVACVDDQPQRDTRKKAFARPSSVNVNMQKS